MLVTLSARHPQWLEHKATPKEAKKIEAAAVVEESESESETAEASAAVVVSVATLAVAFAANNKELASKQAN